MKTFRTVVLGCAFAALLMAQNVQEVRKVYQMEDGSKATVYLTDLSKIWPEMVWPKGAKTLWVSIENPKAPRYVIYVNGDYEHPVFAVKQEPIVNLLGVQFPFWGDSVRSVEFASEVAARSE